MQRVVLECVVQLRDPGRVGRRVDPAPDVGLVALVRNAVVAEVSKHLFPAFAEEHGRFEAAPAALDRINVLVGPVVVKDLPKPGHDLRDFLHDHVWLWHIGRPACLSELERGDLVAGSNQGLELALDRVALVFGGIAVVEEVLAFGNYTVDGLGLAQEPAHEHVS